MSIKVFKIVYKEIKATQTISFYMKIVYLYSFSGK